MIFSSCIPTIFTTGLTLNMWHWICKYSRKPFSHLAPESPSGSMCWWNLWGWDADWFQMLILVCARECWRSVEVLQQLWFIQVTEKLRVTFHDCEYPFSIPFQMLASPPLCIQILFYCRQCGTQHVAYSFIFTSGCFACLWWVFNKLF